MTLDELRLIHKAVLFARSKTVQLEMFNIASDALLIVNRDIELKTMDVRLKKEDESDDY